MHFSHIARIQKAAAQTPEEFGKLIGISGMTLRRWALMPGHRIVPKVYQPAIREACYQLVGSGKLDPHDPHLATILHSPEYPAVTAALYHLGLSKGFSFTDRKASLNALGQIGLQKEKQAAVDSAKKAIFSFRSFGNEWSSRISTLWRVVRSNKIKPADKLVAYGALFYLITPIDFIPDHIPFIGFLDDFMVLGVAALYYAKRFES